jgi:hypothetical protein
MNILQSVIGDTNPKELFQTMVAFMHQTVAHQRKMESMLEDIQKRLEILEQEKV